MNTCVKTCNDTATPTYTDPTNSKKCILCNAECDKCDGPLVSNCLTCKTGKLYYANTKTCYSNCTLTPDFSFLDGIECKKCSSSCRTCEGATANQCLTCNTNTFFYNKSCFTNCNLTTPINTFASGIECKLCDSTCLGCVTTYSFFIFLFIFYIL